MTIYYASNELKGYSPQWVLFLDTEKKEARVLFAHSNQWDNYQASYAAWLRTFTKQKEWPHNWKLERSKCALRKIMKDHKFKHQEWAP